MMRCRPGIVKRIVVAAVPDQRCTTRARALALHRIRDTRTKLLSVMRAVLRGGLVSLALAAPAAAQGDSPAQAAIRAALTQWMADFNAGRADKVCALFAPDLIAVYRGQPDRGYDALCDLLKRSLNDRSKTYSIRRSPSRRFWSRATSRWSASPGRSR